MGSGAFCAVSSRTLEVGPRWKFYRILSAQGNKVRRGADGEGSMHRADRQGEGPDLTRRGGAGDGPSAV